MTTKTDAPQSLVPARAKATPVAATSACASASNMERVYRAIARGCDQVGEIMESTGLEENTVRTYIKRLRDAERVGRDKFHDDRHRTRYFVLRKRCLLAECWRGVPGGSARVQLEKSGIGYVSP